MNWLIDAHLPARLARLLRERGEDAIHTLDLPDGNRSAAAAILAAAARDDRIVVTKDADFVASFRLAGQPRLCWPFSPSAARSWHSGIPTARKSCRMD